MSNASMSREQAREATGFWWLPVAIGVLSLIAGVIVLAKPSDSLATLAVVAGIFVLVDGIAELCARSSAAPRTEDSRRCWEC